MKLLLNCVVVCSTIACGAPSHAVDAPVDYTRDIKPLLAQKCYACHAAIKQNGSLRVDTRAAMQRGGENGSAIIPGKSGSSPIVERMSAHGDERMPPEGEGEALTVSELAKVRAWIDQGAPAPADEKPESDPREHWAFRTPVKPPVPKVANADWNRNPIDAFIAAEHERHGLQPQPEADSSLLLRRLSIDLTGLPPIETEAAEIRRGGDKEKSNREREADYVRLVDSLLTSPQYGERWGRHWMDVWRYSDWWGLGAEVRNSQKHIWHWRDWIIESLNVDKGYDQMIREMLAADELYPNDVDRLRAGGYLARNYFIFNRTTWLDGVIEHSAKGFLGLTINCAKCHDHKYDPVSQVDYYRLRAFFEPYQLRTDQVPGQIDFEKDGIPRPFDCNLDAPTYVHLRGDDTRPQLDRPLTPGLPAVLAFAEFQIEPVELPAEAHMPGLKPHVLEDLLRDAQAKIAAAEATCSRLKSSCDKAALKVAEKSLIAADLLPAALKARATAMRAANDSSAVEAARAEAALALATAEETLARAELEFAKATGAIDKSSPADAEKKVVDAKAAVEKARQAVAKPGNRFTHLRGSLKTKESNLESESSRSKPFPATSTGRRSALARWITDPRNPLTARVAVNHLWSRHFGKPLVPTVFDFGRKGQPPTHPELLDYLACELMEHDWSMKHIHRLIVTSQTYRLSGSSAGADAATMKADPTNRYYWRRDPMRMEAQVVRDSLLHLSGELDLKLGGPSIPATDEASRRRSIYYVHSHNDHQKFLVLFDDAGVLECYRRSESIVPQQALALSNSKLALAAAEKIAARISAKLPSTAANDDVAFVDRAWREILCDTPTPDEIAACVEAIEHWRRLSTATKTATSDRSRVNLVEALLNHNDFVTIR